MKCKVCGKRISKERLDALPNTETCIDCSREPYRTDVKPDEASNDDLVHATQWDER